MNERCRSVRRTRGFILVRSKPRIQKPSSVQKRCVKRGGGETQISRASSSRTCSNAKIGYTVAPESRETAPTRVWSHLVCKSTARYSYRNAPVIILLLLEHVYMVLLVVQNKIKQNKIYD